MTDQSTLFPASLADVLASHRGVVRATHPATSHLAAAAVAPRIGGQKRDCLLALAAAGERGLTDYELSVLAQICRPHVAGFQHSQTLVWCKTARGIGPGGAFSNTTEFVLFCRRGSLAPAARLDTTWWRWPRGPHSVKPPAFLDLVEQVSPGPRVELFARAPRLGWDSWGYGFEDVAS